MGDATQTARIVKQLEADWLDLERIHAMEDPRWIIEGYLPEHCLVVLYGPPGTFKSLFALDWALSIAYGKPWNGLPVRSGPALYIFAEGAYGLKQRVQAWQAMNYEHPRLDAPFLVIPKPLMLDEQPTLDALVLFTKKHYPKPQLIVVDTLARCMQGKENETGDMNRFIQGCDNLRNELQPCSVLVIHHTGKDIDRGARGSIALTAASDVMFVTRNKTTDSIELHNERQKDAKTLDPGIWDLEEIAGSVALRPSEKQIRKRTERADTASSLAEVMATIHRALVSAGHPLSRAAWKSLCPKMGNSRFDSARSQLVVDQRVVKTEDGRYLPLEIRQGAPHIGDDGLTQHDKEG